MQTTLHRAGRHRPLPSPAQPAHAVCPPAISPLMLADRLLTLAQDADHAGYRGAASSLVGLVYAVLDQQPVQ